METTKGKIFLLLGKSGAGKDTILKKVIEISNGYINPIISWTTRPKRENEKQNREYFFTTKEHFKKEEKNFIETRFYNTLLNNKPDVWYYGIHKSSIQDNKNYITIVDLQGAKELISYFGDRVIVIYIDVSDEEREKRAKKRGSFCEAEWSRRLQDDNKVFENVFDFSHYIVENIDLEDTAETVYSIILENT